MKVKTWKCCLRSWMLRHTNVISVYECLDTHILFTFMNVKTHKCDFSLRVLRHAHIVWVNEC